MLRKETIFTLYEGNFEATLNCYLILIFDFELDSSLCRYHIQPKYKKLSLLPFRENMGFLPED